MVDKRKVSAEQAVRLEREIPRETAVLKSGNALGNRVAAAVAMVFGLLTLMEGGTVLFGSEAARLAAGNFVPFVHWLNFMAGFVYILAGAGLWMRKRWGLLLALSIVIGTIAVFAAFGIHILLGGAFEVRTLIAISLRTVVWVVIYVYAARSGPNPAICPDFQRAVERGMRIISLTAVVPTMTRSGTLTTSRLWG